MPAAAPQPVAAKPQALTHLADEQSRFGRALKMARQALDILYQRQAKILGLIFNRADDQSGSYYYYKYADYYGPGSSSKG